MAKKIKYLVPAVLLFCVGWSYRMPSYLNPGVYQLSPRTTWSSLPASAFKLVKDDISSAEPKDLKAAPQIKAGQKAVYASFTLGNAGQKVNYLAILDEKAKWQSLYVDVNGDNCFDEQDRVDLSFEEQVRGNRLKYTIEPVVIPVSYKNSAGRIIRKKLQVDIYLFYNPNNSLVETMHRVVTWFEGEGRFSPKKGLEYPVRFALVDLNGDGNFNNFSEDAVYIDLNYDGVFGQRERVTFRSLFDLQTATGENKQYRQYVFPWPYRLAIVPVAEWESSSFYDPVDDAEFPVETVNPPAVAEPGADKEALPRGVKK